MKRTLRILLFFAGAGICAGVSADPNSPDPQQSMGALGGFLNALGSSLGGAQHHNPVDFHTLESMLPSSMPGLQRGIPKGNSNQAIGIKTTSADVDFNGANNARVNVAISDATAVSGLAGIAEMGQNEESEQGDNYEKNETLNGTSVHETWDAATKHGELSLIVASRYGVDVTGDNVDMDALKSVLAQVDLQKLASMKDANAVTQ